MSATTSFDATAELQAYYGAESGLENSLNVIRGHVQPNGIAGTTKMGFRNAVDIAKSNHASDTSTKARLSAWLDYDEDGIVRPTVPTTASALRSLIRTIQTEPLAMPTLPTGRSEFRYSQLAMDQTVDQTHGNDRSENVF